MKQIYSLTLIFSEAIVNDPNSKIGINQGDGEELLWMESVSNCGWHRTIDLTYDTLKPLYIRYRGLYVAKNVDIKHIPMGLHGSVKIMAEYEPAEMFDPPSATSAICSKVKSFLPWS